MSFKTSKDFRSWVILNSIPGVGSALFQKLLSTFGSPESSLAAAYPELVAIKGLSSQIALDIIGQRASVDVDLDLALAEKCGCRLVVLDDEEYPQNLKNIPDPPPVLYVKGQLISADSEAISVIGSRNLTPYGKAACEFFCRQLSGLGLTIVSGMAKGIDTVAHKSAIEAKGRTIAVLGNGLSRSYPPENEKLMEQIALCGGVISEFPMVAKPMPDNFPRRNRLISGLALGVLVVEASEKSGSLITVSHALSQGREVFAVPGEIFSKNSKGANYLIKQGAKLVDSVSDIIEELKIFSKVRGENFPPPVDSASTYSSRATELSENEVAVFSFLTLNPEHIDTICRNSNLPVARVSSALSSLEIKGLVKQTPGKLFAKKEDSYHEQQERFGF